MPKFRPMDPEVVRYLLELRQKAQIPQVLFFAPPPIDPLDLSGGDFSGLDLSGLTFTGTNLQGSIFDHANLNGASFIGVDASESSFRGVRASGAVFRDGDLRHSVFRKASLEGAIFTGSIPLTDFSLANLTGATINATAQGEGATFQHATMTRSRIAGHLQSSDFRWATLDHADLTEGSFDYALFESNNVYEALLLGPGLGAAHFLSEHTRREFVAQLIRNAIARGGYLRSHHTQANLVVLKQKKNLTGEGDLLWTLARMLKVEVISGQESFNIQIERTYLPADIKAPSLK